MAFLQEDIVKKALSSHWMERIVIQACAVSLTFLKNNGMMMKICQETAIMVSPWSFLRISWLYVAGIEQIHVVNSTYPYFLMSAIVSA